jgi:hypothetical protein
MKEWVERILTDDIEKEPDQVEGNWYTLAPSFLFQSVMAQLQVAKSSGDQKVSLIEQTKLYLL